MGFGSCGLSPVCCWGTEKQRHLSSHPHLDGGRTSLLPRSRLNRGRSRALAKAVHVDVRPHMYPDRLLPYWIRGLLDFVRYHPFWSRRYRDDFGVSIVILSVIFPLFIFGVLAVGEEWEMALLSAFPAFLGGSLAALFFCSEVKIFVRYFRDGRRGLFDLLLVQGLGAAAMAVAFLFAGPPKSLSSVANGVALYPFFIGSCTIVCAPIAIWERSRDAS